MLIEETDYTQERTQEQTQSQLQQVEQTTVLTSKQSEMLRQTLKLIKQER